jgi:acyl-CoA thioesterase-1
MTGCTEKLPLKDRPNKSLDHAAPDRDTRSCGFLQAGVETPPLYRLLGRALQILAVSTALLPGGAEAAQKRVLAFGDSLTAGPGLPAEDTLPAQLQKLLKARGRDVEVVNAGVSGDTTAMGVDRLEYALSGGPVDVAIVELGANDMLKGMSPGDARANLSKTIETFQSKGVTVVLAAMVSSNNWGQAYREEFDSIYPALATKYGVTMVPFFMEGVWGDPKLLIGDGLHPNAAGVQKIANKLAPYVEKALASSGATGE